MMTREEAIEELERLLRHWDDLENDKRCFWGYDKEAVALALSALRPVSREQVEKMRGEWIDIEGEKVRVDKYGQPYGWAQCSACEEYLTASDEYPCIGHFCPNCGAPMTDKAVDMVMERLEALRDE